MGLNDFYDVLKLEMYQFFNIDGQLWNLIIKWDLVPFFETSWSCPNFSRHHMLSSKTNNL